MSTVDLRPPSARSTEVPYPPASDGNALVEEREIPVAPQLVRHRSAEERLEDGARRAVPRSREEAYGRDEDVLQQPLVHPRRLERLLERPDGLLAVHRARGGSDLVGEVLGIESVPIDHGHRNKSTVKYRNFQALSPGYRASRAGITQSRCRAPSGRGRSRSGSSTCPCACTARSRSRTSASTTSMRRTGVE